MALACGDCRAEAAATAAAKTTRVRAADYAVPSIEVPVGGTPPDARCPTRSSRPRRAPGARRHHDREPAEVRALAARVADLERRLQELRPRF
jgi:hypothetical protein